MACCTSCGSVAPTKTNHEDLFEWELAENPPGTVRAGYRQFLNCTLLKDLLPDGPKSGEQVSALLVRQTLHILRAMDSPEVSKIAGPACARHASGSLFDALDVLCGEKNRIWTDCILSASIAPSSLGTGGQCFSEIRVEETVLLPDERSFVHWL